MDNRIRGQKIKIYNCIINLELVKKLIRYFLNKKVENLRKKKLAWRQKCRGNFL